MGLRHLMKSRLLSAVLMTALGIAAGLVPWPAPVVDIPPPSWEARPYLPGLTREEVHAAWGEPDGMLSGFFGDIYQINETSQIILYYDTEPLNAGTADADTVPVLHTVIAET